MLVLFTLFLGVDTAPAWGQRMKTEPSSDRDHAVVLELGAAASHTLGERSSHAGATVAAEVTPIENWLELEFGVTGIAAEGGTELSADLLFKKPWRLSPRAELMAGIGPEVVHSTASGRGTFPGGEAVLDFMYWPRKNLGWYVEPAYDLVSRHGTECGLGVSAGLLIGWP
jgi:hypothetical protein